MNYKIFVFLLSFLAAVSVAHAYTAGDCTNSNDPPDTGDWVVSTETDCSNTTITLNGNFNTTGSVTFRNVTLRMNGTANGGTNISVLTGGAFYIYDLDGDPGTTTDASNITNGNTVVGFGFVVQSGTTFAMNNSLLSKSGWSNDTDQNGLEINTTVTSFSGNTIKNNHYGVIFYSSGNIIFNNTFANNTFYGAVLNATSYNNVTYNTFFNNTKSGLVVAYGNRILVQNNYFELNGQAGNEQLSGGISHLTYTQNSTVFNNTGNNNGNTAAKIGGILLYISSYNNITYNTINTSGDDSIWVRKDSDWNNITHNTIINSQVDGIWLRESDNNLIEYNNITGAKTGYGIFLRTGINNTIRHNRVSNVTTLYAGIGSAGDDYESGDNFIWNNTVTNTSKGIYIHGYSYRNIIENNTVCNNTYGILLSTENNTAKGNNMTFNTYGIAFDGNTNTAFNNIILNNTYGISFDGTAAGNTVKDTTIGASPGADVRIYIAGSHAELINNNTLLNTTFRKDNVTFILGGVAHYVFYTKWYLDVHVNETAGTNLENANVTLWDVNNIHIFSELTDANGRIGQKNITEYLRNDTAILYFTNHTMDVNKTAYVNITESLNITESTYKTITLSLPNCTIPLDLGDWAENDTCVFENQTITLNGNFNITSTGVVTFRNVTLRMNTTAKTINVSGTFYIYDLDNNPSTSSDASNITNGDTSSAKFFFVVEPGSSFAMNNSFLSYCGSSSTQGRRGLEINTTSKSFSGNKFFKNYWNAYFYSSNNAVNNNSFTSDTVSCLGMGFGNGNTIANNTFSTCGTHGIYMQSMSHTNVTGNTFTSMSRSGVYDYKGNKNTINGNYFTGNGLTTTADYIGGLVTLDTTQNDTVGNNRGDNNGNKEPGHVGGIVLLTSSYNEITGNVLNTTNDDAIWLRTGSNYNNITHNNLTISNADAIWIRESNHNIVEYNNMTHTSVYGVFIRNSANNTIRHNWMYNSSSTNFGGIGLGEGSIDNIVWNNTIISGYAGMRLIESSINNVLIENALINNTYGIHFASNANNTVKDTSVSGSLYADIDINSDYLNATLLNVTFRKDNVTVTCSGVCELYVKWYFDAHVNDTTGADLENANVTLWDVNYNTIFSELTAPNGRTGQKNITEYFYNGTGEKRLYTNYTMNTTKGGYNTSSAQINVTQNINQTAELIDDMPPLIDFVSPTPNNFANKSATNITINVTFTEINPDTLILNWNGTNSTYNYSGSYTNITLSNLTDGNHTYYIWVNDTNGKTNQTATRTITIDTTAPVVSIALADVVKIAGSIIEIGCSAVDSLSGVNTTTAVITKPNGAYVSYTCGSGFTDSSDPGTYTVTATATDHAGNSASTSKTFQTHLVFSDYVGSGGGGSIVKTNKTEEKPPEKFNVTEIVVTADSPIYRVSLSVKNTEKDVIIEIKETEKRPDVPEPAGIVNKYVEITHPDLENENILQTKIDFRVEDAWIAENKIDPETIVLNKYTNRWAELPTKLIRKDDNIRYYRSDTSGLSFFAITGKMLETRKEQQPVGEFDIITDEKEQNNILVFGLLILVAIIFGALFYKLTGKKESEIFKK